MFSEKLTKLLDFRFQLGDLAVRTVPAKRRLASTSEC